MNRNIFQLSQGTRIIAFNNGYKIPIWSGGNALDFKRGPRFKLFTSGFSKSLNVVWAYLKNRNHG